MKNRWNSKCRAFGAIKLREKTDCGTPVAPADIILYNTIMFAKDLDLLRKDSLRFSVNCLR